MNTILKDAAPGTFLLGWHPFLRMEQRMTNKKQIMVVDDEPSILMLIELSLKRAGFTVLKANDPFQALSLLDATTPDLFVLDLMMPGMDGLELCKRIRSRPQTADTPVIVFSAYSDPHNQDRTSAAGANAFVAKSEQKELVNRVQALLAN
jgi:CheY-like chemotaxis protein